MKHSQDNGDKNNYLSRLQKFAEANKHLANKEKVVVPNTPPSPAVVPTPSVATQNTTAFPNGIKWSQVGAVLFAATFLMGGYEITKGAVNTFLPQSIGALPQSLDEQFSGVDGVPTSIAEEPPVVVVANDIGALIPESAVIPAVNTSVTEMSTTITPNADWSWCFTSNFAGSNGTDSVALECGVQAYGTSGGLYVTAEYETGFVTSYLIGVNGQSTTYINGESFESRYYIVTHENREYYEFQTNDITQWVPTHAIESSML